MNLGFVCEWEKDRIKTWSSTPYSLYNELIKINDVNLIDINVKNKLSKYQFEPLYRKYLQLKLHKKIFNKHIEAAIQIGDIGIMKQDFYLYQDLNMNLLIDLYKGAPEVYKNSGFQNNSIDKLKKRLDFQIKIYEKCSGVFVFSNYLGNIIEREGILPKNKIHVVYSGINVKPNCNIGEKIVTHGKNILFVGRDFIRKGGDLLVEAFKLLKNEYKDEINLIIAGPKKWPIEGKIPEGIIFLGDTNWNTLQKYYEIADVFCLPSRFEAFGISIVEALCFGIPCIVRNDFAMPELIQQDKNGYLIDKDDKLELAEYIIKALENVNMKKFVYDNRENYKKMYSWETIAKSMVDIIKM